MPDHAAIRKADSFGCAPMSENKHKFLGISGVCQDVWISLIKVNYISRPLGNVIDFDHFPNAIPPKLHIICIFAGNSSHFSHLSSEQFYRTVFLSSRDLPGYHMKFRVLSTPSDFICLFKKDDSSRFFLLMPRGGGRNDLKL